jgi:hypothetical protein
MEDRAAISTCCVTGTNGRSLPGDVIEAYIAPGAAGGWYLADFTTDTAMSGSWDYTVQQASTAEVIVEAFNANGGEVTLANYTEMQFSAAAEFGTRIPYFCDAANGYAEDNGFDLYQGGQYVSYWTCTGQSSFNLQTEGTGY